MVHGWFGSDPRRETAGLIGRGTDLCDGWLLSTAFANGGAPLKA